MGFQKEALLCIEISTYFGVNNFRKSSSMRFIFFAEHGKFHVDSKHLKTVTRNVYGFLDKFIRIVESKFPLLLREYS